MRPVKHGTNIGQGNANARAAPFGDFRPEVSEHRLNVRPSDVAPRWLGEDRAQCSIVLAHPSMISFNGVTVKVRAWLFFDGDNVR